MVVGPEDGHHRLDFIGFSKHFQCTMAHWNRIFHKLIGLVSGALRLQDIARRALEIQFPMAKIMHTPRAQRMRSGSTPRFQDVAGRVAYDEMFDLSRLTRTSET